MVRFDKGLNVFWSYIQVRDWLYFGLKNQSPKKAVNNGDPTHEPNLIPTNNRCWKSYI